MDNQKPGKRARLDSASPSPSADGSEPHLAGSSAGRQKQPKKKLCTDPTAGTLQTVLKALPSVGEKRERSFSPDEPLVRRDDRPKEKKAKLNPIGTESDKELVVGKRSNASRFVIADSSDDEEDATPPIPKKSKHPAKKPPAPSGKKRPAFSAKQSAERSKAGSGTSASKEFMTGRGKGAASGPRKDEKRRGGASESGADTRSIMTGRGEPSSASGNVGIVPVNGSMTPSVAGGSVNIDGTEPSEFVVDSAGSRDKAEKFNEHVAQIQQNIRTIQSRLGDIVLGVQPWQKGLHVHTDLARTTLTALNEAVENVKLEGDASHLYVRHLEEEVLKLRGVVRVLEDGSSRGRSVGGGIVSAPRATANVLHNQDMSRPMPRRSSVSASSQVVPQSFAFDPTEHFKIARDNLAKIKTTGSAIQKRYIENVKSALFKLEKDYEGANTAQLPAGPTRPSHHMDDTNEEEEETMISGSVVRKESGGSGLACVREGCGVKSKTLAASLAHDAEHDRETESSEDRTVNQTSSTTCDGVSYYTTTQITVTKVITRSMATPIFHTGVKDLTPIESNNPIRNQIDIVHNDNLHSLLNRRVGFILFPGFDDTVVALYAELVRQGACPVYLSREFGRYCWQGWVAETLTDAYFVHFGGYHAFFVAGGERVMNGVLGEEMTSLLLRKAYKHQRVIAGSDEALRTFATIKVGLFMSFPIRGNGYEVEAGVITCSSLSERLEKERYELWLPGFTKSLWKEDYVPTGFCSCFFRLVGLRRVQEVRH
ncbi:hypothetical protein HK097_000564 [Rhizophlyctis rosea]|uniref:Uncharacterized protein n=1 Tax=Rhizophlyctis rosea TaxID=64517 RepID=A0AAD5SMS1_9FUNG|nr:hypothetical protein HK097_000564 [Rhizophlyctis rosea]